MKLVLNETINVVEGDSFGEIVESKINDKKLSKLFGILSGLYKNIHHSIVREYCSNAWDSHRMAGKDAEPIMVKMYEEGKDVTLSIEDFGLGMSPETMTSIYFNYLDSTKEDSDDLIGAFGLGSKSALAYTHSFRIDTTFDGILYHYLFSKQSNGIPCGELLFSEPTNKCNGTKILIPVKIGDIYLFKDAIKNELVYFPNVYIDVFGDTLINTQKIYEYNDFIYSPNYLKSFMHICLGNVYYAIDYSELNIAPIDIPIALKFNIGELTPVPSRESLIYSIESINKIKNKMKVVFKELFKSYTDPKLLELSIAEYAPYYRESKLKYSIITNEGILVKMGTVNDKLLTELNIKDGIYTPTIKGADKFLTSDIIYDLRFLGYKMHEVGINSSTGNKTLVKKMLVEVSDWTFRSKYCKDTSSFLPFTAYLESPIKMGLMGHRLTGKDVYKLNGQEDYDALDSKWINKYHSREGSNIYFIKKQYTNQSVKDSILESFQLLSHSHNLQGINSLKQFFSYIKILKGLIDEFITSTFKDYGDLYVDEAWIEDTKNREAQNRRYSKTANSPNNGNSSNNIKNTCYPIQTITAGYKSTWNPTEVSEKMFKNLGKTVIYVTFDDNREEAKTLNTILKGALLNTKCPIPIFTVITCSRKTAKLISKYTTVYHLNEFLNSNHKILIKIATAFSAEKTSHFQIPEYLKIEGDSIIKKISEEVYNTVKITQKYTSRYLVYGWGLHGMYLTIYKNIKDKNLLDKYMLDLFEKFKVYKNKIQIIEEVTTINKYCKFLKAPSSNLLNIITIRNLFKMMGIPTNKALYFKKQFNPIYNEPI